jgi:two-component system sensor kinase FixL
MPITKTAREDPLFDALISTAPDGIVVIDETSIMRVYNRACERLFGYTAEEAVGQNVNVLMPAYYREAHDAYVARYLRTGEKRLIGAGREVSGRRKDGTTFPIYLSVGEGNVLGQRIFVGILTDISERKERDRRIQELQVEMWQLGRLTDMGQMAAGLAHELNQPLTAILNYSNAGLDMARENCDGDLENIFAKVAEQTSRAGTIIRRLRSFIEKRAPRRVPEDLGRTIEDAVRLGMIDVGDRGVQLRVEAATVPSRALIDRVQVQQVLINLIKNAVDAMENSLRREITISTVPITPDYLQVSVADTGPGIDGEVSEKLFQAFVTTKKEGMGMGLNICRTIIEAHGGRLWAEPNPGGGTVFRFNLPIARDGQGE